MQHANFTAWAKACNLLDDKWYVYHYIRRLKTYHRQGQKCDEKTKKETKWQDSPRQYLIPDHGPQHGAVRCSTYWASILNSCIRCSTHCKDQALTHWRYSIEEKESLLQWFVIDSISKKNFVLRFAVPFKKYLFFVYKCITSILLLEQKHTIYSMINDMCISISGHQRPIISKDKNMIKKNQKRNKKTKFSAPEFDVDKWHTCQYHRFSLKLMFQVSFALQKNKPNQKKKQKWRDSPLQDLIPDHGPQHGAVRCSTHWAAGNLSTSKAQYQTYVLGVLRTANIKPRKISAIPQKEKTRLCNILQSSQLVRSNFVHFDLLLLMFFFKKHLSSFIF